MKSYVERRIQSAVKLIQSIGASGEETVEIDRRDVYELGREVYVWVGYGDEKRLVKALDDTPLRLAKEAERRGRRHLVTQVPDEDEVHRAQGHFVRRMYKRYAVADISKLPERRLYESEDGDFYDEEALDKVGDLMGGYSPYWMAYLISCR